MSVTLIQTLTAIGVNLTASFAAQGGTPPYVYSVRANGAGGTINSSTGLYTAPGVVPSNAAQLYDTIIATDAVNATGTAQILVGDPLLLFCDILQNQMGLAQGRVYLWDQKIQEPSDSGLFIAVSVLNCKAFGNTNFHASVSGGLNSNQSVNMAATLQIDIISRSSLARTQKEGVLLALNSDYSQQQQSANSFHIGRLPPGAQFVNLSSQDGAAIPYRFMISVGIQYYYVKTQSVPYFNSFAPVSVNYSQS